MKPETSFAPFDKQIQKFETEHKLPGIAVGIVRGGQLVHTYLSGLAHRPSERAVTAETVFRAASISKTLTAVGVLQLIEKGQIGLHDPVNPYLRDIELKPRDPADPPITVFQLLTHTAGIGEFLPWYRYLNPRALGGVAWLNRPRLPLPRFYGGRLRPDAPPGQQWSYANQGYALLGQLIADVSGQSFPAYMRDHLFVPLGMAHSDFERRDDLKPLLATGYRRNGRAVWPDVDVLTLADGSLFTTVNDFSRYVVSLLNGYHERDTAVSPHLLQPDTVRQMWSPAFQLDACLPFMGLGFFGEKWGDQTHLYHDGLWLGFMSSLSLCPESDTAVFAFTNCAEQGLPTLVRNLLRQLVKAPHPMDNIPACPVQPEHWDSLVGDYKPRWGINANFRVWQGFGGKLTVYAQDGQLHVKSRRGSLSKGYPLQRFALDNPDAFHLYGSPLLFQRTPAGETDSLYYRHYTFYKQ